MPAPSHRLPSALEAALAGQAAAERLASDLKDTELRYRRLFEEARDGILLLDFDTGRITDANPYLYDLLGYPPEGLVGKELWEIGLFEDSDAGRAAHRDMVKTGYIRHDDLPLPLRRGERRHVKLTGNVYAEGARKVIQCNIRDITVRKELENAVVHSEVRFQRLFEAARDGILLLDFHSGRITDANPFMTELLGWSHDELIGKELWEIGLLRDKESSREAFRQLVRDGSIRYENRPLENRRGERREVEVVSNVYAEGDHRVIQCNIRDIAARKAMEVENSQRQLRDKNIALALQRPILFQPKEDAFSGLLVQTAYETASEEALVGGDFWDTFAFDNGHVALVLGDVMGHGLTSAVFTTELKHTMRAYIREHEKPARILQQMNRFLFESNQLFDQGINSEGGNAPVCIILAIIERETGAGCFAAAGMEPPILVRANGEIEQATTYGVFLGIVENEEYAQIDFQLEAGDTLVLTTDGITEARHGSTFLDTGGLIRLAVAANGGTLKEMADMILNGARDYAGGKLRDDASAVMVRRTATSPHIINSLV